MIDDSTITVEESGGQPQQIRVRLSDAPAGDVFIRIVNPDTGEVTVDKTQLVFTPTNFSQEQVVTITGVDDSLSDGPQTTTIRLEAEPQSADAYDGKAATVQATTVDNEAGFIVSKQAISMSQSGGDDSFTVQLSRQPAGDVVIKVTSEDTDEVTTNRQELRFTSANWNEPQTVRVFGEDDSTADGSQTTDIVLSIDDAATADNSFDAVPDQEVVITTTDNEGAGGFSVTESDASTRMTEGGTDTFTVVLTRQPASDVVIAVTASSPEAGVDKTQLRFTRDNWDQAQTVTVTGVDDVNDDGDQTSTITLSVLDASSDDEFDAASDRNIAVTTVDNDPGSVRVKPQALSPTDDAKLAGMTTELRWTQEAGARWLELRVTPFNNDGPGIHLIISDDTQVAAASYTIEDPDFGTPDPNYVLLPDMTYTWQVRTATGTTQPGEADWSPWSDPMQFETGNKTSSTISLLGRTSDSSNSRPTLVWTNTDNDVFYYEVQVSRDPGFSQAPGAPMLYWELRHGGVTSPLNSYTIPSSFPLQSDTTYFWRVRPRVQGDGTPVAWTPAASFRTD